MNLSLIILVLAVIAALSIFGIRFYEFHSGRLLLSREKRIKLESKVTSFYKRTVEKFSNFSHHTKIFFKELPITTAHIMHFYWRKFSKKVDEFFLKIRHKK
jgi:hypothetical protein